MPPTTATQTTLPEGLLGRLERLKDLAERIAYVRDPGQQQTILNELRVVTAEVRALRATASPSGSATGQARRESVRR